MVFLTVSKANTKILEILLWLQNKLNKKYFLCVAHVCDESVMKVSQKCHESVMNVSESGGIITLNMNQTVSHRKGAAICYRSEIIY